MSLRLPATAASSRLLTLITLALAVGCGGETARPRPSPSAPPAPSPSSATMEPLAAPPSPATEPSADRAVEAAGPGPDAAEASSEHSVPSRGALAGGCSAGTPAPLSLAPRGEGIGIAAWGDRGLVFAPSSATAIAIVPIDGAGAPRGEASTLELGALGRVWSATRLGSESLVAVTARCHGRSGLCLFVQRVDDDGHPIGEPGSVRVPYDREPLAFPWPSEATGHTTWLVGSFDTSHAGEGVRAHRIEIGEDGTPVIGALEEFGDDLPDGAGLVGFRVTASETELATIYGVRGEDPSWDGEGEPREVSVRYAGRTGHGARVVSGLGSVVEDLVLAGAELHVLVMRSRDAYAVGRLDSDGALVGELSAIDVTAPLPAPFTDRALAVLEMTERGTEFVVRDSAGRRLGERVAIPGREAALAWTGGRFLVASATDAGVSVVPIDCGP